MSPIGFKDALPKDYSELTDSQKESIKWCCELFELKCYRDFECHCRHVSVKDIDGIVAFLADNHECDVLLVPEKTLGMMLDSGIIKKFDGGKNAFGDDIVCYEMDGPNTTVVPSPLADPIAIAISSGDVIIRLITRETLVEGMAIMSGWVDMSSPDNHFVFDLPWEEGDLYA